MIALEGIVEMRTNNVFACCQDGILQIPLRGNSMARIQTDSHSILNLGVLNHRGDLFRTGPKHAFGVELAFGHGPFIPQLGIWRTGPFVPKGNSDPRPFDLPTSFFRESAANPTASWRYSGVSRF